MVIAGQSPRFYKLRGDRAILEISLRETPGVLTRTGNICYQIPPNNLTFLQKAPWKCYKIYAGYSSGSKFEVHKIQSEHPWWAIELISVTRKYIPDDALIAIQEAPEIFSVILMRNGQLQSYDYFSEIHDASKHFAKIYQGKLNEPSDSFGSFSGLNQGPRRLTEDIRESSPTSKTSLEHLAAYHLEQIPHQLEELELCIINLSKKQRALFPKTLREISLSGRFVPYMCCVSSKHDTLMS